MQYQPHQIYHIFNQGNNRQPIFLQERNYLFFLKKMRKLLLPYVEFLCYTLMPNHFHWLVYTKEKACFPSKAIKPRKIYKGQNDVVNDYQQNLSQAIGILLRSYTAAFNNQENRTGSLFRSHTKAKTEMIDDFITLNGKNSSHFFKTQSDYPLICFNYIHMNAVEAGLVKEPTDWLYSSARDYAGLRNGTLCNQKLANKLIFNK